MGLGAAAEVAENEAEPTGLEVYCPVNEDPEFPFDLDIDVYQDSIRYIDLDEPIYGIERILDEEALNFDVSFSLKDDYNNFDSYTFKVFSADYSEDIASENLSSNEIVNLSGLSTAKEYKISMTLRSDSLHAHYGGLFVIRAELNSTLSVDLFYQLSNMDGDAAPFANENYESDIKDPTYNHTHPNNDTKEKADPLNYVTMIAETDSNDEDYFLHDIPARVSEDGEEIIERGVANLTFTIEADGKDIPGLTVRIFDGDENYPIKTVTRSNLSNGSTLTIIIPNVPLDAAYYIKITSSSALKARYLLNVSDKFSEAWFGQYVSKIDETEYWNANKLNTLTHYAPSTNTTYRIFQEGVKANTHEFATACGVVSSAMIFRNYGLTMNGYDVRTGYEGDLQADPFTAMLSNCGSDGSFLKNTTKFPNYPYPDECHREVIGDKFGLTYESIDDITAASLRTAIANHGYVLIYFDGNSTKKHFMVLTDLKYGSGHFYDLATVYDPAGITYNTGAGVALSKTTSNHNRDEIEHITSAGYFVCK